MSANSDLYTIRDFLRYATSRFNQAGLYFGHGTDNAWDEAAALVLHCLHLPHTVDTNVLDARLIEEEKKQILELIDLRVEKRIPLAYLTNEAWFAGMSFYVDERVLVPRSPIAELIEQHFEPWIDPESVHHVLDLCTGSGCIAIAVAEAFPDAEVDASDISEDALAVAKTNVLRHEMQDEVTLYKADIFDGLPQKKYNLIISNPPYVSQEEMAELPDEYHHEPSLGLEAGNAGLDFVERILLGSNKYLANNGVIIIEVGNSEEALAEKFANVPFTWLEFEHGGGGVFLLTANDVREYFTRQRGTAPR